jgi:hypothetical protein
MVKMVLTVLTDKMGLMAKMVRRVPLVLRVHKVRPVLLAFKVPQGIVSARMVRL